MCVLCHGGMVHFLLRIYGLRKASSNLQATQLATPEQKASDSAGLCDAWCKSPSWHLQLNPTRS